MMAANWPKLLVACSIGLALTCNIASAQTPIVDADRCAANQAAGPIIFLTSFGYAASPGILDLLAAQQQGYFAALCLDVTVQPGSNNIQLVSAGTAQFAGVGGPADVLTGRDNQAAVVSVATYGNTSIIEMLTMPDSGINSIADFAGKTLGYKGAIPPQISAMLLDQGIGAEDVQWVSVGYDPSILPNGQVQGLTAYKSNEPLALRAQGLEVVGWDPAEYGVASSFNSQIVNEAWAKAHPTAVEDFLRASFHGFAWINASDTNLDSALDYAAGLSEAGYDIMSSKARWKAEVELIEASRDHGQAFGWQSEAQWQSEADLLLRFELLKSPADLESAFDNQFIDAIHDGAELIWPEP